VDTRDRILDAAAQVMRTRGFARCTTKEIAKAAGLSEPMIYRHFASKSALFLAVLHERLPSFGPLARALTEASGDQPVRDRLAAIARAAIALYLEGFPISASMFAEPGLLAAHRDEITALGAGPHRPVAAVADYLRAEQRRGRVTAGADCAAAAGLLLGACFQYAFLRCFEQRRPDEAEIDAYATAVTDTLIAPLMASPSELCVQGMSTGQPGRVTTRPYSLDAADTALAELKAGQFGGAAVLVP
jgi:AcrR family transcriptional regulator